MALTAQRIEELKAKYPQLNKLAAPAPASTEGSFNTLSPDERIKALRENRFATPTVQVDETELVEEPEKKDGLVKTVLKDAAKTLLVKPADRLAEVVGRTGILGEDIKRGYEEMADAGEGRDFAGIEVEAQKGLEEGGVRQIAGDVAKSASYLAPVGKVGTAVSAAVKGQVLRGAGQGAIAGGLGGGLSGLGEGLQDQEAGVGEVATKTAVGAGLGAAAGGVLGAAGGALGKTRKAVLPTESEKAANKIEYATKLTAPKLTGKEAEAAIKSGRVTSPGLFKPSKVIPNKKDELVAESVMDIVNPKQSLRESVDAIDTEVARINQGVKEMIADRKIPFNRAQLRSRLNAAKAENQLVFASDATAEKTYNAVVDEFMKHVDAGDTKGLFEARQSFDKVPAIKKLLETERLGENVRKQIVLDVRRAANEYIAEQLPANNPYRAALMKESRMLEALGNIAESNAATIGKNNLQILTEKYPALKWFIGLAGAGLLGGAGVGVGSAIVGSTN